MGQRPTRRGKPHCEAFPAFDILAAERGCRIGNSACEWRDERGVRVGQGKVVRNDADLVEFSYSFSGSSNIEAAQGVFSVPLVHSRRNPYVVRQSFSCPTCHRAAQKLYFVSANWACRCCHNLVFLSQRLGAVNKKIGFRDKLASKLHKNALVESRTRAYHNQIRRLQKMDRELAAIGCAELPDELRFRTFDHWVRPDVDAGVEGGSASESDADPRTIARSPVKQLAYLAPPPSDEPIQPCTMVGMVILGRPVKPFLTRFKHDQAECLLEELGSQEGVSSITVTAFHSMLAERLLLRLLALTSGWSDIVEVAGDEGCREHYRTATYVGDPTLWPIASCAKAYKVELKAVLNDGIVMLRARSPRNARTDPARALEAWITMLEGRLSTVQPYLESFNAVRGATAAQVVNRLTAGGRAR